MLSTRFWSVGVTFLFWDGELGLVVVDLLLLDVAVCGVDATPCLKAFNTSTAITPQSGFSFFFYRPSVSYFVSNFLAV